MVETDSEKYINSLLAEIERRKNAGGNVIYRISDTLRKDVAKDVDRYFSDNPDYRIEIKKCARCKKEYDIIIYF